MSDDHVPAQDPARRNSPMIAEQDAEAGLTAEPCYWNDKKYSDGGTVCEDKQRFKCWNGKWVDIGNC